MGFKEVIRHPLLLGTLLGIAACTLLLSLVFFDKPREKIEMLYERPRIEKSLRDYFAAEMSRDYARVYRCLAPSSNYRRTHSYSQFLEDMKTNPVKILEYKVVGIYNLRPNHDPATYPAVERFAQAEVDVQIQFGDKKGNLECNYCFTFLKEGGAWYKG